MVDIDLLDTHLDLLDTDIPIKYFACLHNVFKASSRHLQDMSSRRLQDMSSRRLQDVFKTNKCLVGSVFILNPEQFSHLIHFLTLNR